MKDKLKTFLLLIIVLVMILGVIALFIPIKEGDLKCDTYVISVELINGKNKEITLELPEDYEYDIWTKKGSYSLQIAKERRYKNIYGDEIKYTYETLNFPGVCFVNFISKK